MSTDKPTQPKASERLSLAYWTKDVEKPKGMLAELKLSQLVDHDARLTGNARTVYRFLVGWYVAEYDSALASVRFISDALKLRSPTGKGLSVGSVQASLTLLTSCGWIHRTKKGTGHQASRYAPEWRALEWASAGKLPPIEISVQPCVNAADLDPSVQPCVNSGVQPCVNATGDSVQPSVNKDPLTLTRSKTGLKGRGIDSAAATPPPAGGLAATAASPAEGFEKLYRAYDVPKNKAGARAAFERRNPDADQIDRWIEAAKLWRTAAGDDVDRMHLKRWIENERYDEDPPSAYKQKSRKAKPTKPAPAKPNKTSKLNVTPAPQPRDPVRVLRRAEIVESQMVGEPGSRCLRLTFRRDDGNVHHSINLDHEKASKQANADREMRSLCHAAGLASIKDSDELIGRNLMLIQPTEEHLLFEPLPANDNTDQRAAA